MKKTILMVALATALGGCAAAQESTKLSETIATTDQDIAAAKKANVNLWVNTTDLLKEAKESAELALSDKSAALKKAKTASMEVQLAKKQAQDNANAGPYYPQ
jgi:heat shock protein HslJ